MEGVHLCGKCNALTAFTGTGCACTEPVLSRGRIARLHDRAAYRLRIGLQVYYPVTVIRQYSRHGRHTPNCHAIEIVKFAIGAKFGALTWIILQRLGQSESHRAELIGTCDRAIQTDLGS